MITRIEVDGFKSLKQFRLDFTPGLNILVGPNGSGKTNIVSFFEFISHLMDSDASEATSRVGGAGAVFRRVGDFYEKRIQAQIVGSVELPDHPRRRPAKRKRGTDHTYCLYEYSFLLLLPETRDSVQFSMQRLRMKSTNGFVGSTDLHTEESGQWDVDVESQATEGAPLVKIHNFSNDLFDIPFLPVRNKQLTADDKNSFESMVSSMLATNRSIVGMLNNFTGELWAVVNDIKSGQTYNVVPSRVKLPEDSAKPPGIARDGSGLAATLYALQKSSRSEEFPQWGLWGNANRRYAPSALDHLKNYLRLVNDTIEDIVVQNEAFDNQLRVRFLIKSGVYHASVPMSLISDGTLKWVALVTAALTAQSVFSIEEPENYMHPRMQGQIILILREILFTQRPDRFTLMTTHSETLLNHCKPEELIIVAMTNGETTAKRCVNAVDVSDEISKTGFGLGYYYLSDALYHD